MEIVVKKTMKSGLVEGICPHYCISCGKIGGILCECCKDYIIKNRQKRCLNCGAELDGDICRKCNAIPCPQICVGERVEVLRSLINRYKYDSIRAVAMILAELLSDCIDVSEAIVAPLPTTAKHIRSRGFDHTSLLAKRLAKLKG